MSLQPDKPFLQEPLEEPSCLRAALEATGSCLFDCDLKAGKIHFSDSWRRMAGYDADELPADLEGLRSLLHPDDGDKVLNFLRSPVERRALEHRLRHRDGSWMWLELRASVAQRQGGLAARVIGSSLDITDRKNLEFELRDREVRWKSAFEAAGASVVECHLTNGRMEFSERCREHHRSPARRCSRHRVSQGPDPS